MGRDETQPWRRFIPTREAVKRFKTIRGARFAAPVETLRVPFAANRVLSHALSADLRSYYKGMRQVGTILMRLAN